MNKIGRVVRSAKHPTGVKVKRGGFAALALVVLGGLAVVSPPAAQAGSSSPDRADVHKRMKHTDDIELTATCNKATGNYDFAAVMTTSNVPSNVTGSTMWRIGTLSFDGTPTSASGMDKGPVSTTGNMTVTLGTWTMPGTTTGLGPWVYAYTTWSNGNKKGSDGQLRQPLKGDCTPDDACPDLPGTQPPGSNCTPPTTDECPDLPGDQPPGAQCEPKSQKQTRHVNSGPNCKTGGSLTKYQERSRTQEYVNGQFVWGKWSKWKTVKATSGSVPPGVCKPKVRAYCVTEHYGEGLVTLLNRQSGTAKRYHIVRSGKDRVVTVGAHKNRHVQLHGLRVGSVVKVKADHVVLAQARVRDTCSTPPGPHTGQRVAAAG